MTVLSAINQPSERIRALQRWHRDGGVAIMGYKMYTVLSLGPKAATEELKKELKSLLVNPGSDIKNKMSFKHIFSHILTFFSIFFSFYRSRLCDLWWGARPSQSNHHNLESNDCYQNPKKGGADWHAASKQPCWMLVLIITPPERIWPT